METNTETRRPTCGRETRWPRGAALSLNGHRPLYIHVRRRADIRMNKLIISRQYLLQLLGIIRIMSKWSVLQAAIRGKPDEQSQKASIHRHDGFSFVLERCCCQSRHVQLWWLNIRWPTGRKCFGRGSSPMRSTVRWAAMSCGPPVCDTCGAQTLERPRLPSVLNGLFPMGSRPSYTLLSKLTPLRGE